MVEKMKAGNERRGRMGTTKPPPLLRSRGEQETHERYQKDHSAVGVTAARGKEGNGAGAPFSGGAAALAVSYFGLLTAWSAGRSSPDQIFCQVVLVAGAVQKGSVAGRPRGRKAALQR